VAWATPRTWVSGDVATAAQFNQDMRDNLTYLTGGDGTTGSGPQYISAIGQALAVAFGVSQPLSMTSIYSTTYTSPATGTAVPLKEAGIYLIQGWLQALPLTSIGGAVGAVIHSNGTVIQGSNNAWFSPFDISPEATTVVMANFTAAGTAAGTIALVGRSLENSATSDMFGSLQAQRVAA